MLYNNLMSEETNSNIIEDKTSEAQEPEQISERYPEVIVNDDFSFTGKDGRRWTLLPKMRAFANYYLEYGGDRIEAIIEAGYDVNYKDNKGNDTGVPNKKLASVMAYELLQKPNVTSYINAKLEEMGFNKENVEEQHLFLLNQHADLKVKMKAVDTFYKLRGRYPREVKGDVNINVFNLAELAEKHTKREQLGLEPIQVEAEHITDTNNK